MKKNYSEKTEGRKLFLQKKADKSTCLSRSSFVKNQRMNGSEEKRCKGINVEGDQSQ